MFHRIEFPSGEALQHILRERLGHLNLADRLIDVAAMRFEQIRQVSGLEKKPSTAELIAWVRVLHASGVETEALAKSPLAELPFMGALAKSEQDASLIARSRD